MSTPGVVNYPASLDDATSLLDAANNAETAVALDLAIADVTLEVVSTAAFPATGAISIDDEIIYYTGKTGTSFTGLLRARDGTAAAAHSLGATVQARVTARHHKVLAEAIVATQTEVEGVATQVALVETQVDDLADDVTDLASDVTGLTADVAAVEASLVGKEDVGEITIAGPTVLTVGAVADGEYLKRSGATVVGDTPAGGGSTAEVDPIDVPPSAPSAYDDEFTGAALDAKWTKNPLITANALALTVDSGRLIIKPNNYAAQARLYGIAQVETGGSSFKIWGKMSSPVGGTDAYCGLMVGVSGGAGKGHVLGYGPNANAVLAVMGCTYNEGATDWSAFDGYNFAGNPSGFAATMVIHHRIRWDAATGNLHFDYSTDGDTWFLWQTRGGMSQPDRIGLVMYAQSNPAAWAAGVRLNARYFRYEANANF